MPLIEIHLLHGRTPGQKKRLLESVSQAVGESIGAPPESIRVWIHELAADEYMVAGKLKSEERPRRGGG